MAADGPERRGRDRAIIGARAGHGRHRLPPLVGIVARTTPSTERRRTGRGTAVGEQRPGGPGDRREVAHEVRRDRPCGLAAIGRSREHGIRPHAPGDRHVRLAREPADLGVVVGAARDQGELAAHALGAQDGREPEDVGQRLEGRAHDAEHEVGLVDELAMALLEQAPEVDDEQVVPGALGTLDELARLGGPEQPEPRLPGHAVTLAQLRVRRQGQHVGAPPRRDREVGDRPRVPPHAVATRPRQGRGREPSRRPTALASRAASSTRTRTADSAPSSVRIRACEPTSVAISAASVVRPDAAREPGDRDDAHGRQDVRDQRPGGPLTRPPDCRSCRPPSGIVAGRRPEPDGSIPHRHLRLPGTSGAGWRGAFPRSGRLPSRSIAVSASSAAARSATGGSCTSPLISDLCASSARGTTRSSDPAGTGPSGSASGRRARRGPAGSPRAGRAREQHREHDLDRRPTPAAA